MFHKLRLRLILLNTFISLGLFFVFVISVYYCWHLDIIRRVDSLDRRIVTLIVFALVWILLSLGVSIFTVNFVLLPFKKVWQQKREYLSNVSHELRTPLAVIQTNLDIVSKAADDADCQKKWLDNIREETVYMAQLVDSLLFLARSDAKPPEKQHFFLNAVFTRTIAPFDSLAAAKGVFLSILADIPATDGWGDEIQIRQIISILLDNAIRHTPVGGIVSVSLLPGEAGTVLTVADSGEGIEPECLDKIFDRFYQINKIRTNGGFGLGLAIARSIVKKHGGEIKAASTPGAGTTFTVTFPWKAAGY
ncbi:Hypothetical protein LUCI_4428 [Lucifera butyrica]|uniref:histidine kinase n=1 Tax=Lucifera butyrica TaxID=1351585 RepID=A0A498RGD6_9FIRM|nr:ATP-binding protein [Lucifera butyrica]VBB09142.1 Hypothetical protein LUCI_4428 [Lucifera butyrica]